MNIWMYYRDFAVPGRIDSGGITKAVTGLATALAGRSARVAVLCEATGSIDTESVPGYRLVAFPQRPRIPQRISAELRQFLVDEPPPDLAVLNGIFSAGVAQVARVLKRRAIPYVHAPHDPYSPAIFARNRHIKIPYWWALERPLLAGARAVQVLDAKQEQWLRVRHIDVPVITVPNGVFKEEVPEQQPWRSDPDRPISLLFLGRLDAFNKGIDLLIDAAESFGDRVTLTIQGPDVGDGRQLAEQAKARHVPAEFLPPDYATEPSHLIARHDLLCLPSRFDGFGLTALEAMVAGRVLLVSEEAGIATHVSASGCGLVVAPTVAGIRSGLNQLLERREEWPDMGKAGRDYVLANLVWDQIAERALEDYKKLVGAPAN